MTAVAGVERGGAQTYAQTLSNARCCAGYFFLVGLDLPRDFVVQPWLKDNQGAWPTPDEDWILVGVIWCVTALLSGVVFAQAVRERQGEIGLFLAKGAHRGFVLGMLIKESLLVSSLASLSGAALAVLLVASFRQFLGVLLGIANVLPSLPVMVALVVGLCIFGTVNAVCCALLPAVSLLRTEPYEAIKRGRSS